MFLSDDEAEVVLKELSVFVKSMKGNFPEMERVSFCLATAQAQPPDSVAGAVPSIRSVLVFSYRSSDWGAEVRNCAAGEIYRVWKEGFTTVTDSAASGFYDGRIVVCAGPIRIINERFVQMMVPAMQIYSLMKSSAVR